MLFSVTIFPVGADDSLEEPVSRVVDRIDRAGLDYQTTGMNTVVEGDWEEVMPVIREAYDELRRTHDRVYLSLDVDAHPVGAGRLTGAVEDVEEHLGRPVGA